MLVITIDRQSTHARNDLRVIRKFLAARWSSYLRIEAQMKKRLIMMISNFIFLRDVNLLLFLNYFLLNGK